MTLSEVADTWQNTPEAHQRIFELFTEQNASIPQIASHRKWIEDNRYGFGERGFHGVWYQLAKELPDGFSALEVGVFRGQSISAIDLAAQIEGKKCTVYGLSPFNGADGDYYEKRNNYADDVEYLFSLFNGNRRPVLIHGYSTDVGAKAEAALFAPFDMIYLDACHQGEYPKLDINYYAPLVKVGGYFLSDDSVVGMNVPSWFFQGFVEASKACDDYFSNNFQWRFLFNVMHLRVYKKVL